LDKAYEERNKTRNNLTQQKKKGEWEKEVMVGL